MRKRSVHLCDGGLTSNNQGSGLKSDWRSLSYPINRNYAHSLLLDAEDSEHESNAEAVEANGASVNCDQSASDERNGYTSEILVRAEAPPLEQEDDFWGGRKSTKKKKRGSAIFQ